MKQFKDLTIGELEKVIIKNVDIRNAVIEEIEINADMERSELLTYWGKGLEYYACSQCEYVRPTSDANGFTFSAFLGGVQKANREWGIVTQEELLSAMRLNAILLELSDDDFRVAYSKLKTECEAIANKITNMLHDLRFSRCDFYAQAETLANMIDCFGMYEDYLLADDGSIYKPFLKPETIVIDGIEYIEA